jgi:hypothetical protein
MTDRREAILARLLAIAEGLAGVDYAARNVNEIPEGRRPAVQIFDADEKVAESGGAAPGHRAGGPQLVTMSPEIVILLGASAKTVGSELNAIRAALIKAIMTDDGDDGLIVITGAGSNTRAPSSGSIRYMSSATSLGNGRSMEGAMGVFFEFTYPLKPSEL